MTIGQRIKKVRMQIGLSQVDLADKINVTKQTLYKYENGIVTNIPSDKIEAVANLCHVSPGYLMGWEGSSAEEPQHQDPDQAVLDLYHRLDSTDQAKVVERMEVLLEADKYAKGKESQAG